MEKKSGMHGLQMSINPFQFKHFVVPMRQLPGGPVTQKPLHKSRMHRMPRPLSHHPPLDPSSRQRQIPNQIKHFVPHKLIWKTKRPIFNPSPRKNNGALIRNPTNQAHIPQHGLVFLEPKSPRRSNLLNIIPDL